jgi:hypothetical protein
MIYWPAVALASLAVALYFFLAVMFPWQAWAELLRRGAKYVRVTWGQMRPEEKQVYAADAVLVVWFVWWSVAIVKGW